MFIFNGKIASKGIAIGKIKYYSKTTNQVVKNKIENTVYEKERYENAKRKTIMQLQMLYEKALKEAGEESAEIFQVHDMLIEDEDFNEFVSSMISKQKVNAEYAVEETGKHFAEIFSQMDDEYFKARSTDIKDISDRLVRNLVGEDMDSDLGNEPVILFADDLTPSETMQIDKTKLLAFVTLKGSTNSHTAILARTMDIPGLVTVSQNPNNDSEGMIDVCESNRCVLENCELAFGCLDGKFGIVDAEEGKFIIDPDEATRKKYEQKKDAEVEQKIFLKQLIGKENITKSGKKIKVFANIGNPEDVVSVNVNDAGGIGLFRSEFLYLEAKDNPDEEQQFQAYKKVLESMNGKKVIIRTLDIGADKQVDYFHLQKEENPALGYRAIRISLTRPEIFRTQLRALFRASEYGNLAIMYPMIISVDEVIRIREIVNAVKEELAMEGIRLGEVEEGIMIETPAAAIMSRELAAHVDFFSIGTNDLTQYTLALDRQNASLEPFYDAQHPALLRLIKMVIDNAHNEGIEVGICGELAADTSMTKTFVEMGVDELSVAPGSILKIRNIIRNLD